MKKQKCFCGGKLFMYVGRRMLFIECWDCGQIADSLPEPHAIDAIMAQIKKGKKR